MQGSSELATLVAQSLAERRGQQQSGTHPVSSGAQHREALQAAGSGNARAETAGQQQRPDSAQTRDSTAKGNQNADAESPVASSPQS